MENIFEWYLEKDLYAWLDGVCYYSFLNSSVRGKSLVPVCLSDVILNNVVFKIMIDFYFGLVNQLFCGVDL